MKTGDLKDRVCVEQWQSHQAGEGLLGFPSLITMSSYGVLVSLALNLGRSLYLLEVNTVCMATQHTQPT